jgi:hypothetical protein
VESREERYNSQAQQGSLLLVINDTIESSHVATHPGARHMCTNVHGAWGEASQARRDAFLALEVSQLEHWQVDSRDTRGDTCSKYSCGCR